MDFIIVIINIFPLSPLLSSRLFDILLLLLKRRINTLLPLLLRVAHELIPSPHRRQRNDVDVVELHVADLYIIKKKQMMDASHLLYKHSIYSLHLSRSYIKERGEGKRNLSETAAASSNHKQMIRRCHQKKKKKKEKLIAIQSSVGSAPIDFFVRPTMSLLINDLLH